MVFNQDQAALQSLYRSDPTIKRILDFFGQRQRTRSGTLYSMRLELRKAKDFRVSIEELYTAGTKMEKTGYVRFLRDKEKKLSRIEWNASLPKILEDASAGLQVATGVHETISANTQNGDSEAAVTRHVFRTGDGRTLSLPYFSDLSVDDAVRIGKFYESVALQRMQ